MRRRSQFFPTQVIFRIAEFASTGTLTFTSQSWVRLSTAAESVSGKSNLCTRCITPKRVTSRRGPSPHHYAIGQNSSFRRMVEVVANRWQHRVRFDWPEIWTSDLPFLPKTNALPLNPAGRWKPFFSAYICCEIKIATKGNRTLRD